MYCLISFTQNICVLFPMLLLFLMFSVHFHFFWCSPLHVLELLQVKSFNGIFSSLYMLIQKLNLCLKNATQNY